jgi:hypothetical protein
MSPRGARRSASLQRRLRRIHAAQSSVTNALSAEVKKIEQAGWDRRSVARLIDAAKLVIDKLSERGHAASAQLMKIIGISDEEVDALIEAKQPKYDERWWSSQILATPRTESLDTLARQGTAALINLVPPQWFLEQSAHPFRLGKSFRESPLRSLETPESIRLLVLRRNDSRTCC